MERKSLPVHPDSNRLAHDVFLRNLAPNTAVTGVVAIITHHKIMPRLNYYREVGGKVAGYQFALNVPSHQGF